METVSEISVLVLMVAFATRGVGLKLILLRQNLIKSQLHIVRSAQRFLKSSVGQHKET